MEHCTDIHPETTVRELVGHYPAARRVFEEHGIDYCCGGNKSLSAAAEESETDLNELIGEVAEVIGAPPAPGDERNWYEASLTELASHIVERHHNFLKRELPRLETLIARVTNAHGEHHGEMLESLREVYLSLKGELDAHLQKEELVLFPYVTAAEAFRNGAGDRPPMHCGTVQNPIVQMECEHENAGGALEELRQLTDDYTLPDDACPSFAALYEGLQQLEADLHNHIHLENNILFPRALALERDIEAM